MEAGAIRMGMAKGREEAVPCAGADAVQMESSSSWSGLVAARAGSCSLFCCIVGRSEQGDGQVGDDKQSRNKDGGGRLPIGQTPGPLWERATGGLMTATVNRASVIHEWDTTWLVIC